MSGHASTACGQAQGPVTCTRGALCTVPKRTRAHLCFVGDAPAELVSRGQGNPPSSGRRGVPRSEELLEVQKPQQMHRAFAGLCAGALASGYPE